MFSRVAFIWMVVLLTAWSAQAEIKLVIVPFTYAADDGQQLSDAISFELDLDEELLLVPYDDVVPHFDTTVSEAEPDEVMRAMKSANVDLLLRAERIEGHGDRMLMWLVRGSDGLVVFGWSVVVQERMDNAVAFATDIAIAAKEAQALPALSQNAQAALRQSATPVVVVEPEEPKRIRIEAPPDDDLGETAADADAADAPSTEDDAEEGSPFDKNALRTRIAGLNIFYGPSLLRYRACNPERSSFVGVPCQPKAEGHETVNVVPNYLAGRAHLEVYPWIPYVGLHIDGGGEMSYASIQTGGDGNIPLYRVENGEDGEPTNSLLVWGFQGTASLVGRAYFEFGLLAIAVGARIGYHGGYRNVPAHFIRDANGDRRNVTLIPTMWRGAFAPGLHAGVGIGRWVKVIVDADGLGGLQCETTSTVAQAAAFGSCIPAVGARGRAQLDVDVAFGVLISAYTETTYLTATATGTGSRETRTLEVFESGAADILDVAGGVGVGYRF